MNQKVTRTKRTKRKQPTLLSSFVDSVLHTLQSRGQTYDKGGATKANFALAEERNMLGTITAFNALTGRSLTEAEGWLFMQLLKMRRQATSPQYHPDSMLDQVAYSLLEAECREKELLQSLKNPIEAGAQTSLPLEPHRRDAKFTAMAKETDL